MAHALRANYREQLGGDEALVAADWRHAVELGPDDIAIRYYRGHYHRGQGAYTAALADFDRLCALAPDLAEAYYLRASARSQIDEEHADEDDWEEDDDVREA